MTLPLFLLLSFPPFELSFLAWVALAPLLKVIAGGVTTRRALWLGWLAGLEFTFFADNWVAHSMTQFGQMLTAAAYGHETITTKITWSQEIARIVQKRCIACHAKEPVDFSSYESARPWAKAIKEEVLNRRMPPWGAVKGFGEFRDDLGLSQEELNTFAEWVEGGAPEGDPNLLPADRFPDPSNA